MYEYDTAKPEETSPKGQDTEARVFTRGCEPFNKPGQIVTFGRCLPAARVMETHGAVRYLERTGRGTDLPSGYTASSIERMRQGAEWTKFVADFNKGRQWALRRLVAFLDPMLEPGIAIAVVPAHDPFGDTPPIRILARHLAATGDRTDATGCLVRHTGIKRIVYGGPSYRHLHRDTIAVQDHDRLDGRPVLLLDDIARSGASLLACREMLLEAGARTVQAVALARVVSSDYYATTSATG